MVVPMKSLPQKSAYKKGDVLVLFGELFSRGYANGIVEEAQRQGLTIIRTTVGRRDGSPSSLRALTPEEMETIPQPFINIPLEAGFDMEPDSTGKTPVDYMTGFKMDEWRNIKMPWAQIKESRARGSQRFINHTQEFVRQLEPHIPAGANVLFVHTMAGGVPRTKIIMPVMNRVFKGREDRFVSSKDFLESDMGQMAIQNFEEVTAFTYKHLIDLTSALRGKVEKNGGHVSYVAYGYHGTEVLHGDEFQWQTYTPYFQGWAKMKLEDISKEYSQKGINTCVFNCPEILTNSSGIFQGVEVSLYPLVGALEKLKTPYTQKVLAHCKSLLKPEHSFKEILDFTHNYFKSDLITSHSDYKKWPQHNTKEQMAYMLDSSDHLIDMHEDPKNLMTFVLSEEVFKSTGSIMLHESWTPRGPVLWLGHDILAQQLALYK
jgi:hypothetical protein